MSAYDWVDCPVCIKNIEELRKKVYEEDAKTLKAIKEKILGDIDDISVLDWYEYEVVRDKIPQIINKRFEEVEK